MQLMLDMFVETHELLSLDVNVAKTKLLITRYRAPNYLPNPTSSISRDPIEKIERLSYIKIIIGRFGDLDPKKTNQRISERHSSRLQIKQKSILG